MLDQPVNKNNRRKRHRPRLIIVTDSSVKQYYNNNIVWPVASARKAHSSAFVMLKTIDCQLIIWLAEIMINLRKKAARRAHWSGPCGHRSGCRLIQEESI